MSAVDIVTEAVDGLLNSFQEFKTHNDERFSEQECRLEQLDRRLSRAPISGLGGGANAGSLAAERRALGSFVKSGSEAEFKSLSTDVSPSAGYLALPAMSAVMTKKLWDSSPIRRLARIQVMTTGTSWQEPLDRDEAAAEWVAWTAARPTLATPTVGLLDIPLNEIFSNQPVNQRLLDLSFVDVGAWIEGKISDKFARAEAAAFLTGNGAGQPMGILSCPIVSTADATRPADKIQYIAGGDASLVTADSLRKLYWGLRAPYRSDASWLMSSATGAAIDQLKATVDGQYLWR